MNIQELLSEAGRTASWQADVQGFIERWQCLVWGWSKSKRRDTANAKDAAERLGAVDVDDWQWFLADSSGQHEIAFTSGTGTKRSVNFGEEFRDDWLMTWITWR